jgi:AraC-like DNA-binding protein
MQSAILGGECKVVARSPLIPARYVEFACRYAGELGIPRDAVHDTADLDDRRLAQADTALTVEEFASLTRAVSAVSGRSDSAFELGSRVTFELHGALGAAMRRCTTLDQAARLASRYFALITPAFLLDYRRVGRVARIAYRPTVAMSRETLMVMSEILALSFHALLKSAAASATPAYDVWFPMKRPPHAIRYEHLPALRAHFEAAGSPELRLEIEASFMDEPTFGSRHPDASLDATAAASARKPCPRTPGRFGDWVAMRLREAENCQPTLGELASFLRMPAHTLARRLAQEGLSFRDLANDARLERAARLLRHSGASVAEIAARLGYTYTANFSSAFRARTGLSPRAFRQSVTSPDSALPLPGRDASARPQPPRRISSEGPGR